MRKRKPLFSNTHSERQWTPDIKQLDEVRPGRQAVASPSWKFWMKNAWGLMRKLSQGLKYLRLDLIRLEGTLAGSDSPLQVLYLGHGENMEYFCRLFFSGPVKKITLGKQPIWQSAPSSTPFAGVDLLCREVPLPWSLLPVPSQQAKLLCWVKQGIPIAETRDAFINTMRRKTRMEAERVIRKYALSVVMESAQDQGSTFYHALYRPYIESRFGEEGVIVSEARFLAAIAEARLLLIKQGDTAMGGLVLHQQGTTLIDGWTGIRLEEGVPVVPGISDVIDYCCLYLAYQEGFSFVDMGTSRAFLNDGTLKYKLRWGARLSAGIVPKGTWTLALNSQREDIRAAINQAGIIGKRKQGLIVCQIDEQGNISEVPLSERLP